MAEEAVSCEPLSTLFSLLCRECTGNWVFSALFTPDQETENPQISAKLCEQFPAARTGNSFNPNSEEYGLDQGFERARSGNHARNPKKESRDQNGLLYPEFVHNLFLQRS